MRNSLADLINGALRAGAHVEITFELQQPKNCQGRNNPRIESARRKLSKWRTGGAGGRGTARTQAFIGAKGLGEKVKRGAGRVRRAR